jgi:hypothetical protein
MANRELSLDFATLGGLAPTVRAPSALGEATGRATLPEITPAPTREWGPYPWASHVVVDRNLVTGQNPFSSQAMAKQFLEDALTSRPTSEPVRPRGQQ